MKKIFSIAHSIIIGYFILTGNDIYDTILGAIIAVIGYIYAYQIVKYLSPHKYKSVIMSFEHWVIRTIIVVLLILIARDIYMQLLINEFSELNSVVVIGISAIMIAEVLKKITGLNKSYF